MWGRQGGSAWHPVGKATSTGILEPVRCPSKGTACPSWESAASGALGPPEPRKEEEGPAANQGAGCKKCPHPRATRAAASLAHSSTHITLAAAGDTPGLAQSGRGIAGHRCPDHLCHCSLGTDEGRGAGPKAARAQRLPCRCTSPRLLRQLHTHKSQGEGTGLFRETHPEEDLFLALIKDVCCLRWQVPSLPPRCCSGPKSPGKGHPAGTPDALHDLGQFFPVFLCLQRDRAAQTSHLQSPPSREARSIRSPALLLSVLSSCHFIPVEILFYANKSPHCP